MIQPFEAYVKYLAIRQHFESPSYDYFRYNGKIRANQESFERRRDKFHFAKLGKMNDLDRRIAISMVNSRAWVTDVITNEADSEFLKHLSVIESFSYKLINDYLPAIEDIGVSIKTGTPPKLLSLYFRKIIPIELLVVFDDMFQVCNIWDKTMYADPLWQKTKQTIVKYRPFFTYDKAKVHKIIVDFMINKG